MSNKENPWIKDKVDELVSDLACCDRNGCRCWQAKDYMRQIAEYANEQAGDTSTLRAQRKDD